VPRAVLVSGGIFKTSEICGKVNGCFELLDMDSLASLLEVYRLHSLLIDTSASLIQCTCSYKHLNSSRVAFMGHFSYVNISLEYSEYMREIPGKRYVLLMPGILHDLLNIRDM
jgi:hypothetical protein